MPGRSDNSRPARPRARARIKEFASREEALRFLEERTNVERARPERLDPAVFRLDRMHAMLAAMGDPHRCDIKFVHVAGSKGKGSTCEMVTAALTGCGYTTGLYTSPHLVDVRERVRIGPAPISEEDFRLHLGKAAAAAEAVQRRHGEATFFELLTGLALSYFHDQAVDVAVVEVGLGGRLDSTNVITPEVCAVTAIQLEHTQILGDTLEKIAREKAGIFKPGVQAITIPQQDSRVLEVLRQVAGVVNAPLSVVGEDIEFSCRFAGGGGAGIHDKVCVSARQGGFEHITVPLKGRHQAMNCALALSVLNHLRLRGLKIPERQVAEGLARTLGHGRLEVVSRVPLIVIDGAHNPESIEALVQAVGAHLHPETTVVIFGCAADKNVPGMLTGLARMADKVIFTRAANSPRAADPRDLQRKYAEVCPKMAQVAPTLADALGIARRAVHQGGLICITGSFYLAGEAKTLVSGQGGGGGGGGGGPQQALEPKPLPRPGGVRRP